MDNSFEDWNHTDENSPFNIPEEIDVNMKRMVDDSDRNFVKPFSYPPDAVIGSPNPMDVSALQNDDDMAPDANPMGERLKTMDEASEEDEEAEEANKPEEETQKYKDEPKDGKNLEDTFNEICQKVLNDPDVDASLRKNLVLFMDGMQNARSAEKKVEAAYIATEKLLEKCKTTILEAALPLYDYLTGHMEKAEAAILANFSESHKLRKSILAKFEELNKSWLGSFEELKKRLVCTGNTTAAAMSTPDLSVITGEDTTESPPKSEKEEDKADEKMEGEDPVDLDWEEIISLNPELKECIETFLACREKWSNAVDRFGKALDAADDKLSKRQQHMLEILANAHRGIYDNLAESQESLMSLFVENHIKRETLEEHFEQKASLHIKFFKRMKQHINGGNSKADSTASTNDSPERKSSHKKFSSIRKVFKRTKAMKRSADSQEPSAEE